MKAHVISLVHAVALIGLGGYGYLSSDTPSVTALIPVVFGVLLLAMNNGIKKENKVIAHIAVLLTLLIIVGLVKPLTGAMGRGDNAAVARVATCLSWALWRWSHSFAASLPHARRGAD